MSSGFEWPSALRRLGEWARSRRVPVVTQLSAAECGAACLAMVLAYHGKRVRLDQVREAVGVTLDGASALALTVAAKRYGLRARGVRLEVDDLRFLETGAVLHWQFNHFVVFERMRGEGVQVVDPAVGRRRLTSAELRRGFTGVALLFEPGAGFERGDRLGRPVIAYLRRALLSAERGKRILVLSLCLQLFALVTPVVVGAVVDRVVPRSDAQLMTVLAAGCAALLVFNFLTVLTRAHLLLHARTVLHVQMAVGFLEHLVSLPFAFLQRRATGDLMMRLNSNASIRDILTGGALAALLDGMLVSGYALMLAAVSGRMAAVAVGLALLQVAVFVATRGRTKELMAEDLQAQTRTQSYQLEMFTAMESLKAMGVQRTAVEYWTEMFVDSQNVLLRRGQLNAFVESTMSCLRIGSPLVVLLVGASLVLDGAMTLGTMLALNALAAGFLLPVANLMSTAEQLLMLGTYVRRLDDVFEARPEQESSAVRDAPPLSGRVQLEDVAFSYSELGARVVQGVSVSIEPGQFVAIVGPSGSGKSTLANLLLALYEPVAGRILYDGNDLKGLDSGSVRRQFGVVMQRTHIFAASVRDNIALADPSLTLAEVTESAKFAQLHDDILAMPMGYDTPLAEGGSSISGGQRQRIALARALVRKPTLLLLDEATSALDSVTESHVQAAIESLRCTRIVIAHRLSTIVRADLILVMKEGALVERGKHQALLERRGAYYELLTRQLEDGRSQLERAATSAAEPAPTAGAVRASQPPAQGRWLQEGA